MKILVVEDSGLSVKIIEQTLKKTNHTITIAKNGSEAIEKIKTDVPDLILTDVMMPYVSGLELIKWVKDTYQDAIRIIVLTSLGNEDIVIESFTLGADDFIAKPFQAEDLLKRIERFNLQK